MKKILIYAIAYLLIYPYSIFAIPVIPDFLWDSGFGIENRAAYTSTNPTFYCVSELSGDTLADDSYVYPGTPPPTKNINGNTAYYGSLEQMAEWFNETGGNGIIMFDVSGTIDIGETDMGNSGSDFILLSGNNLIIAGQTAPPPGITIRGGGFRVSGDNILIQHLRIRMDDENENDGPDYDLRRAISVAPFPSAVPTYTPVNVVVDHCSFSWSMDQNGNMGTTYGIDMNVTYANCIFSEGLYDSFHTSGTHSKGFLMGGGDNGAIVQCLFAHNSERNPELNPGSSLAMANCVIYNAGTLNATIIQGGSNPTKASFVGNYIKGGTNSGTAADEEFPSFVGDPNVNVKIHIDANRTDAGTQTDSDDWQYVNENTPSYTLTTLESTFKGTLGTDTPWPSGYTAMTAANAYTFVLANAGARPNDRDAIDDRIIEDVGDGSGSIVDAPPVVGGVTDADGFIANDTLADRIGNSQTWDLGSDLDEEGLNNMPSSPHTVISGGDYDSYTNVEKWLDELSKYCIDGTLPASGGSQFSGPGISWP